MLRSSVEFRIFRQPDSCCIVNLEYKDLCSSRYTTEQRSEPTESSEAAIISASVVEVGATGCRWHDQ